ncbi:SMI1/KNR4 family protein [Flavobacterium supellecticarium]|uniref:SMI1/KNR4 family protein n=1 Tax=Flavobacterium supellecticarium TaxID=2565924 RepID=A0A4S4A363_9FLAO|nr:SMI1/KNR4 family protein [Flavobacterium supellecticarium]THF52852.1 SMI1/KNR4 family protein [Flavobacterium supellecticarium]
MIDFRIENERITVEELNEFEEETGVTLPEDYRVHMLQYNGGSPFSYYLYFGEPDDGILLFRFKSIKYGAPLVEKQDYLPENYLSIGYIEAGYLAMSLDKKEYGSIFVYYSEVELTKIAASFTAFLDGLVDYTATFE